MSRGIDRQQIERVARMYRSNQDASRALGITIRSFNRLCHKYEVESPYCRHRRRLGAARRPGTASC